MQVHALNTIWVSIYVDWIYIEFDGQNPIVRLLEHFNDNFSNISDLEKLILTKKQI